MKVLFKLLLMEIDLEMEDIEANLFHILNKYSINSNSFSLFSLHKAIRIEGKKGSSITLFHYNLLPSGSSWQALAVVKKWWH